jgi:hypothetical protein
MSHNLCFPSFLDNRNKPFFAEFVLWLFRLLLPLMCRKLMRCIKTAAKHATPVIKERMAVVDAAEEKDTEPELPVSTDTSTSAAVDIEVDIFSE